MRFQADMAIYDKAGQLALVVEAKNKLDTTSDWAARMRRNLLAHGLMPNTRFFLLALPDRFYLWKDAGVIPEIGPPHYEIDPKPLLRPYYNDTDPLNGLLTGASFELVVSSWLNTLLQTDILPAELQEQEWLVESGLFEAIKSGHLAAQVVV